MPNEDNPTGQPVIAERSWRVNGRLTVAKFVAAAAFLVVAVAFLGDPVGMTVALVAALALVGFATRDLLAPVRLAADRAGVTVVTGFNGRRQVPWARVERVRLDERRRFGVRSQLVEIDTGDTLHLFSGYELSASCEDVVEQLEALRRG
jgi:hypothetical protein